MGFLAGPCFSMQYIVSFLVFTHEESWLLYINCVLASCGCKFSVSLPHGAVFWSVIVAFTGHTHFLPFYTCHKLNACHQDQH